MYRIQSGKRWKFTNRTVNLSQQELLTPDKLKERLTVEFGLAYSCGIASEGQRRDRERNVRGVHLATITGRLPVGLTVL